MNNQRDTVYYLPSDTAAFLTAERVKRCKNLGLILDKYPERTAIERSEGKSRWLKDIEPNNHIDSALAEQLYRRWFAMTDAMDAQHFRAAIDWRMIIGLGGETILETDITLHHLYGIPYIPGSALKGLARAYVTGEIEEYKSNKIENDNDVVKRIFGSQEHAGTVIFFDAMPVTGKVAFVLDIMNPHYPDYYGGNKAPTNDQSPVPITFLTVTDTSFTFALAPRSPKYSGDVNAAKEWLQAALKKYGIGSKTSAGYGYFKEIHDEHEPALAVQSSRTTSISAPSPMQKSMPTEHIRPNIPKFKEGQEITGSVVAPTDDLRQSAPSDSKAFLRYQSFSTKDVLITVSAEEAQNWKPGETRICVFRQEQERDGFTILVCQPRPKKK